MNDKTKQALELASEELQFFHIAGLARLQTLEAITALREALTEQPAQQQEPVAWMYVNKDGECEQIEFGEAFDDPSVTLLYTAPPKREWVGLTDDEEIELDEKYGGDFNAYIDARDAKLKEKNGY